MRTLLLALTLAAAPATGRADHLRLEAFDGPGHPAPGLRLGVPLLSVPGLPALALDEGEGGGGGGGGVARRQRIEPAVALILGIIPGFGIGHLVAGSSQWTIWLIVDIIIFVVWPGGFFFTGDRTYSFLGLLVLVERIIEGISAYQAAGGGPVFRSERAWAVRDSAPRDLALPVGASMVALR
jgi:hypothetical protein